MLKSNYSILTVVGLGVFVLFVVFSFFDLRYLSKTESSEMMVQDIAQLTQIFHQIHATCGIISFDYQKNPINFLNVKDFTGSEVGPMNLVHPDKWQGPYLQDNPTMQGKEYQIVETKKGYFITPGDGVKLPNGKVIGKDIPLNKNDDIFALMRNPKALLYNDMEFAAHLDIGASVNIELQLGDE